MYLILYCNYTGQGFFEVVSGSFNLKKFIKLHKKDFIILAIYYKRDLPPNLVDFFV